MKMSYAQVVTILDGADQTDYKNWELPIGFSLQLARIMDKLTKERMILEQERMKLLKKYSELDENGEIMVDEIGNAKVKDMKSFQEDYSEMLSEEIDLDIKPIKINFETLEAKGISLKPSQIFWLLPLIEWDENES